LASILSKVQRSESLLFPEGFTDNKEKKQFLTFKTIVFFDLISSILVVFLEIKTGDSIKID